ncbi:DNA polymerase III subunit delta [Dichotomicrobium thermohalophilum]|uniref:DNA-directed DNA polymerase n=1 Tax=Dichotomicrobium thermohalophilum TaxID=933063 RepID=A0A397QAD7_9HYPH|nr:DNA polymerase III subunit delta [Dichotomicrobium thermohalophilum]RIA55191.1 DNA polymerase III delta subunit [Dichotomicrobium thermohalophilum]
MVLIKANRVARYVQKPDPQVKACLLFGSDAGLIREHGATLCESMRSLLPDNPELVRLNEDDLAADPDRLAVEAQTISMFSPSKVLRARVSGRTVNELAKFPWGQLPDSVRVVIEVGNLKPDIKLRKLFEGGETLAALACYESSDTASLSQLVRQEISRASLTITRDAERHLTNLLGADPGIAKAEIAKLITYAQDTGEISVEDVDAVVGDASDATLNVAVHEILTGDSASALTQMEKLRASGTPPDVLLSALSRQLMQLISVRARMDAGRSADSAINAIRPPLHFRRKDEIKLQIRRWDRGHLKRALGRVSRALQYTRTHPEIAHQVAGDTIFQLARTLGKTPR